MNAQNPTFPTATQAVGIDAILLDLQTVLDFNLDWLTNAMGRAYVLNKQQSNGVSVFRPQVWLGGEHQDYHEPLPDNDRKGSSFFIVKPTDYPSQQVGKHGFKEIDVSIIFTVNLEMIDSALLLTENFTRHQILAVEDVLIRKLLGKKYRVTINTMTDRFEEVFAELDIDTLQGKVFGKMSYFRFDTTIFFDEDCPSATLNRCGAITQNLSHEDFCNCLFPLFDFGLTTDEWFDCLSTQQKNDLTTRLCGAYVNEYQLEFDGITTFKQAPINAAYDFTSTDSFSLECWPTVSVAKNCHIMNKYDLSLFRGWFVRFNTDGSIRFDIQSAGGPNSIRVITAPGVWTVGTKHHLVAVYTGTETVAGMAIYLDGVSIPLITVADNFTPGSPITTGDNLKLGALPSAGLYFNGAIDEWRIRNIALTPVEVPLEWNGGTPIAPIAGGLVLYDRQGEGSIYGVSGNWVSPDLSGTLGVDVGTETVLMPYSSRIPA